MTHKRRRKALLPFLSAVFLLMSHAQAHARHLRSHHAAHENHRQRIAAANGHGFWARHVIQCVAFAKSASAVALSGNARDWWHNAEGVYARGNAPEAGSVLNFRRTRRMPLGHVAVVRSVEDSRTIYIDQSHWASNGISRHIRVVDVSPDNDWSAVRVALDSRGDRLGAIYPTYGFIYARSEGAAVARTAPSGTESARTMVARAWRQRVNTPENAGSGDGGPLSRPMDSTEVAEAPDSAFQPGAVETGAAPIRFRHHRVLHHRRR